MTEKRGALPTDVTHWEGPPLEAWRAWTPHEIATLLRGVDVAWCVVGGWAIDLFLGAVTRAHGDLEVAIPRTAFRRVREHLARFDFYVVGDGETRLLAAGAEPPADKHQNWVVDPVENVWRVDVMLEPGDASTWVYRRDPSIRAPRAQMTATRDGMPYLKPEGTLLFKAKWSDLEKNEADLRACLPRLDAEARRWLCDALARDRPGHAWIERLSSSRTVK